MVRSFIIGTALLAATTFIATAHDASTETETRTEHRAQFTDTGGHQGREYMQNGVLVIEGAPRWTEYRASSATRTTSPVLDALIKIFD
ncbi:hypothetical protein IZ6_05310 [Terrihabitans soli]|uniref:Uncharacterized protein n=1 Tax=Terrihabitans soli TaxID=708113 RepID=A0A6S6QKK4_9HYPH|nr:hypothetical protein [Terrihabitans soli]BCJ89796.1 hypothetical protein IZ6_05310 [Terrihabitans soli]